MTPIQIYYEKRAGILVKNLKARHFEACYCATKEQALNQALTWVPEGASVSWGGAMSADQIGLTAALKAGNYKVIDRSKVTTVQERDAVYHAALSADVYLTGANALSLDGQMVSIDGTGNRVAAIVYGPTSIVVIVGMNKVCDDLDAALTRARTVAAPMNCQRFDGKNTPCAVTGTCGDCKSEDCICNQILITRNCRPAGRIKFVLVGEDLGL